MAELKNESPQTDNASGGEQKQNVPRGADRPRQNTGRRRDRSFHRNTPAPEAQRAVPAPRTETRTEEQKPGTPHSERPAQNRDARESRDSRNGAARQLRRRPAPNREKPEIRPARDPAEKRPAPRPAETVSPEAEPRTAAMPEAPAPAPSAPAEPASQARPVRRMTAVKPVQEFRTETAPMPEEYRILEEERSAEAAGETAAPLPASDTKTPVEIVGVRFKPAGKVYYFDPAGAAYKEDDAVIVETVRGIEYGFVVTPNRTVMASDIVSPLKVILRRATEEDRLHYEENNRRKEEAFRICQQKIAEHRIEMKLVDVEYTFDNNKLLFYFTADGRVDFRELVKDLASVFRTRIELRQIGIRDEAKLKGGLGVCGRPFCCHSFLSDFVQVSIKMAKEQNLSLNSAKISGTCGRLMCCLRYEYDVYEEEIRKTPKLDAVVETPDGEGVVCEVIPLAGLVRVKFIGSRSDVPPKLFHRDLLHVKGKMNWKTGTITYYEAVPPKPAPAEAPAGEAAPAPETAPETAPEAPAEPLSAAPDAPAPEEAPAPLTETADAPQESTAPVSGEDTDLPDSEPVAGDSFCAAPANREESSASAEQPAEPDASVSAQTPDTPAPAETPDAPDTPDTSALSE